MDQQVLFVGGPNMSRTNPRWRTAWKIDTLPYLGNTLTNLNEIWCDDTDWASLVYRLLIILICENPRWQTAAILKTVKMPYLCNYLTDLQTNFIQLLSLLYCNTKSDITQQYAVAVQRKQTNELIEQLVTHLSLFGRINKSLWLNILSTGGMW